MSKGDWYRPVDRKKYIENWEKIWGQNAIQESRERHVQESEREEDDEGSGQGVLREEE